ncbi:MAG: hypothetical protein R3198_13160, partial [Marinobacter sp.]|nr:hypothetical protein [Marinobacter sp.]
MPEAVVAVMENQPEAIVFAAILALVLCLLVFLMVKGSRATESWRQRAALLDSQVAGLESESRSRLARIEQLEAERTSQQQRVD